MPCNTITTQSIKLANAMPEILKKALQESGWILGICSEVNKKVTATKGNDYLVWEYGKGFTIQGMNRQRQETSLSEISQAYSKQAVTWAAQRAGWQVTNVNQNTLNIVRR